jgi:hypothetical protein
MLTVCGCAENGVVCQKIPIKKKIVWVLTQLPNGFWWCEIGSVCVISKLQKIKKEYLSFQGGDLASVGCQTAVCTAVLICIPAHRKDFFYSE